MGDFHDCFAQEHAVFCFKIGFKIGIILAKPIGIECDYSTQKNQILNFDLHIGSHSVNV